jgi:23S rRNA (uracil1939-C5)-methyltransferase
LPKFGVERIVYVSCNPATLVRDSKILQDLGYQAQKATIMDMFTHTSHIETMTLFDKV